MGADEMKYLRQKIPDLPSLNDMFKTVSYSFLNTNELLDIPMPTFWRTKYLGGIAMPQNNDEISQVS
jgi:hypothetical protein